MPPGTVQLLHIIIFLIISIVTNEKASSLYFHIYLVIISNSPSPDWLNITLKSRCFGNSVLQISGPWFMIRNHFCIVIQDTHIPKIVSGDFKKQYPYGFDIWLFYAVLFYSPSFIPLYSIFARKKLLSEKKSLNWVMTFSSKIIDCFSSSFSSYFFTHTKLH